MANEPTWYAPAASHAVVELPVLWAERVKSVVADAANNKVDVYNGNFSLVKSFTDSAIPAGFAPFGIQDISGQLYVTFASTTGGSGGYIDIFGEDGTLVKHFAHGAPLNQPWGLAVAPSNFGTFSGALLVSNNTFTGTINAFNLTTGKALGTLKTTTGKVMFGRGATGRLNQASTPDRKIATPSSVVATGRSMKRAERFMLDSRPADRSACGG